MALRGIKPEAVQKRLKAFFYGSAGVGKTMAAIQFPAPYIIDTEGSTDKEQYVNAIKKSKGAVFITQDFEDLISEIKDLLTQKHEYKTLVIDSLTILYDDLLDKAGKKVGTDFGRHYNEANKKMKHLLNLLFRLDMNVVITSHAKNEYGQNMSIIGQTFDCYKKLDYLFDLVFEIQKRGKERVGIVKKSRIHTFPDGEQFPFSYDEISKRYGKDVLEKEVAIEKLATIEQITEVKHFIDLLKVSEEVVQKWLDKANAETLEEISYKDIQKIVEHFQAKIKTSQPANDKTDKEAA